MRGRTRLTWVTALTIASLLVGSGALNALANEHGGGKRHGEGAPPGQVEHQQQLPAVVQEHDSGKHDGTTQAEHEDQPSQHGQATGGAADRQHGSGEEKHEQHADVDHGQPQAAPINVQPQAAPTSVQPQTAPPSVRRHEDMDEEEDEELEEVEELVTQPARVTEEVRPGLGCGDADDHSGPPGNPGKKCKHPHDNDNDVAAAAPDAPAADVDDGDEDAD